MDLLLIFVLLVLNCADGIVPAVAKSRKARQWIGQLEIQSDCTFPVVQNSTISPVDQVSLCNFTTSGPHVDGVYSWRKGLASMANWLGGPTVDASNTTDGGYAYFETSSLAIQQLPGIQAKAWLKSPVYQATTPNGHCLRFAYNIQGASASKLRLLRVQMLPLEGHNAAPIHSTAPLIVNSILMPTLASRQQHERQAVSDDVFASPWTPFRTILMNHTGWQEVVDEVWLSSDSTRGRWIDGHVTYSSPYPHAFIFEAVPDLAHLQYRGHVAVDNIEFSTGPCRAECEFNSDFCQWSSDPEGDFDWSLSRGSLWTSTGPIRDQLSSKHNFNFGGYAFIDSRQPHFAGSRASLTSQELTANNALCFVFWVHMFGAGIGRLRVFQKEQNSNSSSDSLEREIWELSQSGPRDSWYRAQVTLASSSPFKIRLEATVGESGYGDIAVDSFRIENGSCPGLPEWAVNKGVDCTFQNGNCGWVLTNSQPGITSMWTRSSADILSGRPDGHSQQNVLSQPVNNYMLFDTYQNGHKPGSRGFVSSPLQRSNESHCLSFWFYLASASPSNPRLGALEVVLFEPNSGSNETSGVKSSIKSTTLWRLENHQEEKWLFAQVPLVAAFGGYVSFVGVKGEAVRGIIAIDDITLYRSTCPILPAEAEVSRLDCSFDSNLCNWNVDSQTVQLSSNNVANEEVITEKEEDATTAEPDTLFSRIYPGIILPELQAENEPSVIFPVDEGSSTTEYDVSLFHTTGVDPPPLPSTDGAIVVELIPGFTDPIETTPTVDTSSTSSSDGIVVAQTMSSSSSSSSTFQTMTAASVETTSTTTSTSTTDASKINPSDKIKLAVSENGNKDVRGVSGLYDEITSFGPNAIEVISTSRDGATKSIIISQPVRNNRFRRSASNGWIGYNQPRHSRIVSYGNNPEETVWRRPLPVPHWLRSHRPEFSDERDNARGQISPYSFRQPSFSPQRIGPKQPSKLFSVSSFAVSSPVRPIAESSSTPSVQQLAQQDPRWVLASLSSSLYGVRDHTLQLSEGGYVYFEGKGKPSVSRLFSPEIPGNVTQCLSFFFTMAYNSPNSTLTVYRFNNGPLEELWRVTSTALDRLVARTKSPWIPARVPISSKNGGFNQTIVIEGSTDSGAIGLDDIRLQEISCSSRP